MPNYDALFREIQKDVELFGKRHFTLHYAVTVLYEDRNDRWNAFNDRKRLTDRIICLLEGRGYVVKYRREGEVFEVYSSAVHPFGLKNS